MNVNECFWMFVNDYEWPWMNVNECECLAIFCECECSKSFTKYTCDVPE